MHFKGIKIRNELKPGDLGMIIHLHGDMYFKENAYTLIFEAYVAKSIFEFYQQFDPALDRVWVCEDQGKMIGFLSLVHRPENAAQLRFFFLLQDYRGMGLGSFLMEQFMAAYHELGYTSAYLWTTEEQLTATALYKKHGFQLTEEKPSDAFGKSLVEQRYVLD